LTGIITIFEGEAEALVAEAREELRKARARVRSGWWCILRLVWCGFERR